jgi:hypothetical protein
MVAVNSLYNKDEHFITDKLIIVTRNSRKLLLLKEKKKVVGN